MDLQDAFGLEILPPCLSEVNRPLREGKVYC